jgi:hypothetical protein
VIDAAIARLVDTIYIEPDFCDSAESFERYHHDDVPYLSLDEIDAERILARLRWAAQIYRRQQPSPWLTERIAKLDDRATRLRQKGARR